MVIWWHVALALGWEYQFEFDWEENPGAAQVSQLGNMTLCWCSKESQSLQIQRYSSICLKAVIWYLLHSWQSPTCLLAWCVMCVCPCLALLCFSAPPPPWETVGSAGHSHKYNSLHPQIQLWRVGTNTSCSKDSAEKSTRTPWTQNKVWKEGEGRLGYRLWLMGSTVSRSTCTSP